MSTSCRPRLALTLTEVLAVIMLLGLVATVMLSAARPDRGTHAAPQAEIQLWEWRLRDIARVEGGLTIFHHEDREATGVEALPPVPSGLYWLGHDGQPIASLEIDASGMSMDYFAIWRRGTNQKRWQVDGLTGNLASDDASP